MTHVRLGHRAVGRRMTLPVSAAARRIGERKKLHVLIVDDEPLIGRAFQRVLQTDYEVTVLTGSKQAKERIEAGERFDAILCDVMMDYMTGTELHRWLLEAHPSQAERLAFVTGAIFCDRAVSHIRRSAVRTHQKPISNQQLRALVQEMTADEVGASEPKRVAGI